MHELPAQTIDRAINGPLHRGETRKAFEHLYHHYHPYVSRAVGRAARRSGREGDAHEVCQEVWCRLLDEDRRRLRAYDAGRSAFGAFLTYIAFYEALAVLRLRRMRTMGEALETLSDEQLIDDRAFEFVADLVQSQFLCRLVDEAAAQLSKDFYVVLVEVLLHGRTCRDLAQELGVKENTIAQRKKRILARLQSIKQEVLLERIPPPSRGEAAAQALLALLVMMASMAIEG